MRLFQPTGGVLPASVDAGDTEWHVPGLKDLPAHGLARLPVRLVDVFGRDDAALAMLPRQLEAGQLVDCLRSRVVRAAAVGHFGGEVRQQAEQAILHQQDRLPALGAFTRKPNEGRAAGGKNIARAALRPSLHAEKSQQPLAAGDGAVVGTHSVC